MFFGRKEKKGSRKKMLIPQRVQQRRASVGQGLRVILLSVLIFELGVVAYPTAVQVYENNLAAVLPAKLATLTNEEREKNNLTSLSVNPLLTEAAERKAKDMAEKGYFSHISPDGKEPWYWLEQVGYEYDYAGENLAMNFKDSEEVTAAWMDSPTHRANIIKSAYTEIGTGTAIGVYEGKETIFIAQIYAHSNAVPAFANNSPNEALPSEEPVVVRDVVTKKVADVASEAHEVGEVTIVPPSPASIPLASSFVSREASDAFMLLLIALGAVVVGILLARFYYRRMHGHRPGFLTNGLIGVTIFATFFFIDHYANIISIISTSVDYSYEESQE